MAVILSFFVVLLEGDCFHHKKDVVPRSPFRFLIVGVLELLVLLVSEVSGSEYLSTSYFS